MPEAVQAVLDADWVVFGPGSWFTSVLPHLLVPQLAAALHVTAARRLVVLNLDLRDTQRAAIGLYESLGYRRWGTHPSYAQVEGRVVPGHYYYKRLDEPAA